VDLELAGQLPPGREPEPARPGGGHLLARIALWTVAALLIGVSVWAGLWLRGDRARRDAVRVAHLQAVLSGPIPGWLPGDDRYRRRVWAEVAHAYARQGRRLLWSHDGEPGPSARAFVSALAEAPRDGLDPADYGEPAFRQQLAARRLQRPPRPQAEAARIAALDVRLTASFLRFARELHDGRVPASQLDPDWMALRDTLDVTASLGRAIRSARAARRVAELGRSDPEYRALRDVLRAYREIEARGGWPAIPAGPVLKPGMKDERCTALRARLAMTGDLARPGAGEEYDRALATAVGRYQSRMGLDSTGRLDDPTRRSLNVPAAERRRTLELNLERMRWLPAKLPDPLARVNIPESHLRVRQTGTEPLSMRAVVGAPTDPTPVFSDIITYLEFHPTWGVPKKILANEMLPQFRKDDGYFFANAIRVFDIAPEVPLEVDPRDVPWERVEEDTFPYVVRQDAGPQNPLGQIKFMCPNEYDVYLHDTPARRFFERSSRFLSHGCVRVQDPLLLAAWLLEETPLAPPESLVAIMADSTWRRVGLKRRLPVLVEYRTAWVDEAGVAHFRPDVYGLDKRLDAALRSGHVSDFELNPKVLRNPRMPLRADWAALRSTR
jgi:murein L,D-transpeptidase YcbB/YkuD